MLNWRRWAIHPSCSSHPNGDSVGVAAATHMVKLAAGTWNALLFVPGADRGPLNFAGEGSDDLIDGVVARLEERR